ncbi:TIGR04222 domain-containing membrane protein [Pseudonocardia spinosispora]|uniref:TIGR04222 domain-containing membrane protein n=1 Tax=Pseudonocardia spinosispora TaxID=103441 RepID=UPI0003FBE876|nr:TIGR04222 domain-containing membrane protein [Pseudonocardia spinosispora]
MTQLTLAAPGDTWGISGPTFLGLYWIVTAATVVVILSLTRAIRLRPPEDGSRTRLDDEPYLAAYLHGGPDLALTAALATLRAEGLVRCRDTRCEVIGTPPDRVRPDLETAVLGSLTMPRPRSTVARRSAVVIALRHLRNQLIQRKLLMSDAQHADHQSCTALLLVVLVLGVVRLVAGMMSRHPVLYLGLSLLATLAIGLLLVRRRPKRTLHGDRELARLTVEHEHLAPHHRPDWTASGAGSAAMAVALFGEDALHAADPEFAEELAERPLTGFFRDFRGAGTWSPGGGSTATAYGAATLHDGGNGESGSGDRE